MGDRNQLLFGWRHRGLFRPPFLEIGSREEGYTVSFRDAFPATAGDYLGVDSEPGPGVDVVLDLTADFSLLSRCLPTPFATILCLSVLEHCRQPFLMAENMQRLLAPGGVLYVSVPFAWEIHHFPADYWRFTPDAVRLLFPEVDFRPESCAYHSQEENVFYSLENGPPRLGRALNRADRPHGTVYKAISPLLGRSRWIRRTLPYDYLFPPVQLEMIGRKREAGMKNGPGGNPAAADRRRRVLSATASPVPAPGDSRRAGPGSFAPGWGWPVLFPEAGPFVPLRASRARRAAGQPSGGLLLPGFAFLV